jgi:hypothetical protein
MTNRIGEHLKKGTAVRVRTTNNGECVGILAADYVPSYALDLGYLSGPIAFHRIEAVELEVTKDELRSEWAKAQQLASILRSDLRRRAARLRKMEREQARCFSIYQDEVYTSKRTQLAQLQARKRLLDRAMARLTEVRA